MPDSGSSIARIEKIKFRRKQLSCSYCPPNRGENASRKPKRGVKKPKYKNHRISL